MKVFIKSLLNFICKVLIFPFAVICKIEERFMPGQAEVAFNACAQLMAIFPGLPGAFLRRAFYSLTLESCSPDCHIGFGTIFSHRSAKIDKHVYIGNYVLLGSVDIGEYSLIGSRVSILNGEALHELDDDGRWTPFLADRLSRLSIDKNVWIGEAALIMADVGEGSLIGAGSVVTAPIKSHILVAGNPARFVKKLN